jgi:hypothetical protein
LDTEKEKGSDAALLYLPVFDAQSTLLQCSAVIGVTALLALLGRFLPKLRAASLRPFFLSGEPIHGLPVGQVNSAASSYIKSLSACAANAPYTSSLQPRPAYGCIEERRITRRRPEELLVEASRPDLVFYWSS